jgi:Kef-type K+ transport system membrane component KefB
VFAEIFQRVKLPVVLGEMLAGIMVGPYALGGLPLFDGGPLVVLDETVKHIGELSAIVILFVAGLEITPREFLRGGAASFTVGALGVVVPFFVGFGVFSVYGLNAFEALLVATALTATSIAISIQVLTELGKMQTKEARLILGAAIVDDILAIAVLSVVVTMVQSGNTTPDILHREKLWRSKGSIEGITTAIFFGTAGIAAYIGLSPIVGAFAVGMAIASTKLIKQVEEYVHKLQFIFAPLFFAIIGAQVDLRGINLNVLVIAGIVVAIAISTKLLGCGLPSWVFLKDKTKSMRVGVGMISRGEVGLIVAGVGVTTGALSTDIYTAIIIMVALTTIITPIWLKNMYQKELPATTK